MAQSFTIRGNPGEIVKAFNADDFESFKAQIAQYWTFGSEQGLESFFNDRFQVKAPIGQNRLVCR